MDYHVDDNSNGSNPQVHFTGRYTYLSALLIWAVLYWFQTPKLLSTDWAPDLKKSTDHIYNTHWNCGKRISIERSLLADSMPPIYLVFITEEHVGPETCSSLFRYLGEQLKHTVTVDYRYQTFKVSCNVSRQVSPLHSSIYQYQECDAGRVTHSE